MEFSIASGVDRRSALEGGEEAFQHIFAGLIAQALGQSTSGSFENTLWEASDLILLCDRSKFNELMSQEKEIDFEKFDSCEKNVRAEMENIQTVLTKIQQNKFEDFPDEEKKGFLSFLFLIP